MKISRRAFMKGSVAVVALAALPIAAIPEGKLFVYHKSAVAVSVKDYGAVGDGLTDDTVSIQVAIDAADAAGGGTVWFHSGMYNCRELRIGEVRFGSLCV